MGFMENYCKNHFCVSCSYEVSKERINCQHRINQLSTSTIKALTLSKNLTSTTSTSTTLTNNNTTLNSSMETIMKIINGVKDSYDNTIDTVPKTVNHMNTTLILLIILVVIACATFIIVYCICQRMTLCTSCCMGCNSTWFGSRNRIMKPRPKVTTIYKRTSSIPEYDELAKVPQDAYENDYLKPTRPSAAY